jgi:hypothetical protein
MTSQRSKGDFLSVNRLTSNVSPKKPPGLKINTPDDDWDWN